MIDLLIAAGLLLSLALQQQPQPDAWRTVSYSGGKVMRFLPPQITEVDYPPSAMLSGIEGRTLMRLTISPAGQILDCAIQGTSGSAELDARACAIYRARARFELRNFTTNHIVLAPVRWRVETGASVQAAASSASAAPAATQPASPSAGSAALRTSDGSAQSVSLGAPTQVTPAHVIRQYSRAEDLFERYHTHVLVTGRSGQRFEISWQAPVPIQFEYGYEGYDSIRPPGARQSEPVSAVTVTLERAGEHRIVLTQDGITYRLGQRGALMDPAPRAFQPYAVTVRRLP